MIKAASIGLGWWSDELAKSIQGTAYKPGNEDSIKQEEQNNTEKKEDSQKNINNENKVYIRIFTNEI